MNTNANDTLSAEIINNKLITSFIGRNLEILPTIHSTNLYLKEIDTASINSGFTVIANEQTGGRGRRGRVFHSPGSQGIYLSILLRPDNTKQDLRLLTICAAVAVSKAIEKTCNIRAEIKWVNDIFCNGKKICGILTEATISGELQEIDTIIVGIGINTGNVPVEVKDIATSILETTGMTGIRNQLIAEVLNEFEAVYLDFTGSNKKQDIIDYYTSRLFIIGNKVLLPDTDKCHAVTVLGIDNNGALAVKDEAGDVQHISTGEIMLIKEE